MLYTRKNTFRYFLELAIPSNHKYLKNLSFLSFARLRYGIALAKALMNPVFLGNRRKIQ